MKERTAHTRTQGRGIYQHLELRVRDSTAAAATWLDMARHSDTVRMIRISQRYTSGGAYSRPEKLEYST